jgi:hypothetical protein
MEKGALHGVGREHKGNFFVLGNTASVWIFVLQITARTMAIYEVSFTAVAVVWMAAIVIQLGLDATNNDMKSVVIILYIKQ